MIILLSLLYSIFSSTGLLDTFFHGNWWSGPEVFSPWGPFNTSMLTKGDKHLPVIRKEVPKQKDYIITYKENCPTEGYFFKKDTPYGRPEVCYLCFCKEQDTAICWPRDNKKCDLEHYQSSNSGKREKRSPGFTDLFFRDAARDALNHQTPEECKPHEGSYSIGCPPADWCVGCTVCDCDANGRWDCHLLSFCTEDDKKRQLKARGKIYVRGKKDSAKDARFERNSRRQLAVKEIAKQMANPRKKKTTPAPKVKKPHHNKKPSASRRTNLEEYFHQQELEQQQDKPPTEKPKAKPKVTKPDTNPKVTNNKPVKKPTKKENKKSKQGKTSNPKKNDTSPRQNSPKKRAILRKRPPAPVRVGATKLQLKRNQKVQRSARRIMNQTNKPKVQTKADQSKIKQTTAMKPKRRMLDSEEASFETETTTQRKVYSAIDMKKMQEDIQNNYQKKILSAVQKMIEEHMGTSKKVKRSAPVMKKVVVKKSVQDDVYRRPYNHSRPLLSVSVSAKKQAKINVERSNKVKLHRHRRSMPEEFTALTHSRNNLENDISTNSLQVIPRVTTQKPKFTTQATYNYYKYFTDNIMNATSLTDEYPFTKNTTAKRSIDTQLEVMPKLTVLSLMNMENQTLVIDHATNDKNNQSLNKNIVANTTESIGLKNLIKTTIVVTNKSNLISKETDIIKTALGSTSIDSNASSMRKSEVTKDYAKDITTADFQPLPISVIPKLKTTEIINNKSDTSVKAISVPLIVNTTTTKSTEAMPSKENTKHNASGNSSNVNNTVGQYITDITVSHKLMTEMNILKQITTEKTSIPNDIKNITKRPNLQSFTLSTNAPKIEFTVAETSFQYNVKNNTTVKHDVSKFKKKKKYYRAKKPRVNPNGTKKDKKANASKSKPQSKQIVIVLKKPTGASVTDKSPEIKDGSYSELVELKEIKALDTKEEFKLDVKPKSIETINVTTPTIPNIKHRHNNSNAPLFQLKKKKFNSHDVKMSLSNRKHKLKKVVPTLYKKITAKTKYVTKAPATDSDNADLKNFFRKLIGGFDKKGPNKSKANRYKIIKYLQKFFQKLFTIGKHKKNKNNTMPEFNKQNVIETLCATFGPCNINVKNKMKLQSQIEHLNTETYNMLRSVKILKGLLKLVDIAKHDRQLKGFKTEKSKFKSDIQKLHAILRDTYVDEEHLDKLTDTQKTQIEYIKNSTQSFIQSAAKFTLVLNDIIHIISVQPHKIKDHKSKTFDSEKEELKRNLKLNVTAKGNETGDTSLKKLKDLVSKYTVIQNAFMRKMYKMIADMKGKEPESTGMSTEVFTRNKTEAIQVYTKNIIQNLRKLKNLAQMLNGSSRKKRELRDDDSIEYLLLLMEYLLKQNHPVEAAPVNDGIDLLIEAIKNAPDIKPNKNKVINIDDMKKSARKVLVSRNITASKVNVPSSEGKVSREDSMSDNISSKEENITSQIDESKIMFEKSSDDEGDEDDDKFVFTKRKPSVSTSPSTSIIEKVTEKPIFSEPLLYAKVYMATYPSTTESSTMYSSTETTTQRKVIIKTKNTSPTNVTRPHIQFNAMVADVDEDVTFRTIQVSTTPTLVELSTQTEKAKLVTLKNDNSNENTDESASGSKSKLDWLDESYEEEVKAEINRTADTDLNKRVSSMPTLVYKATNRPIIKKVADFSAFSKETSEEVTNNTNTGVGMYKKDMDLLNSLDYGKEKSDVDVSDSKESISDDKYSGDGFASYFN